MMLPPKTFDKIVKAEEKRKAKLRAAKKLQAQKNAALAEFCQAAIAKLSQPRQQTVTYHVRDTGNLEKAVSDCWSLKEERGMEYVLRIVRWLGKDSKNPIIWNGLPDKEPRDAWLVEILP